MLVCICNTVIGGIQQFDRLLNRRNQKYVRNKYQSHDDVFSKTTSGFCHLMRGTNTHKHFIFILFLQIIFFYLDGRNIGYVYTNTSIHNAYIHS